jgi:hypothetical protein
MKIEHVIGEDKKISDSIKKQAIFYKGETYIYFDSGLTRYVFVNANKTKVIKILIDQRCKDYNEEEVNMYNNASDEQRDEMAKTVSTYDGYVVEQEFCNPIKWDEREMTIKQMKFAASCRQEVGWTADGRLVCFDLDEYKKW